MDSRARAFRATVIKLGAFAVTMILVLVGLVLVFSRYQGGSSDKYTAVFTSASSLKNGSVVKIAGVDVGSVSDVALTRNNQARVHFSVNHDYRLPTSVQALIRYQNLTGDRYLELQPGTGDVTKTLAAGDEIPVSQTEPALDLDKLLGGFKPLFRTLDPQQVNKLSSSLIAVFQGQGAGLNNLLANTAEFTDQIADRDALIGSVIDNLNQTLGTLEDDHRGLDQSVDRMQQLISGLAGDRSVIGESITQTSRATTGLASLMNVIEPDVTKTVSALGKTSEQALKSEDFIRDLLGRLPGDFKMLSNLGSYGAWLQIYFCRIRLLLPGPGNTQYYFTAIDVMGDSTKAGGRCAT
ncbi:MCE family protein [Gordonia hydrophobica]|uniref:MlaD family protein n=1 Tax=Gordonia hydrophobica TaxID=40516 RepID=A0ABZ2TVQ5_9ACTN|nr:MlaD family protein [Gordonia hydrophobica]MBM7366032.1 phospholipid/cholesterol/gamma-HCH transport system substrate-binding protein [Gordonia hydrophobica]